LIHEVLEALEITQLEIPGVEADDVIATLTTQAADQGIDVVIVTGDRDSYQLVRDPHVKVLYNKRGVSDYALYDEAGIAERCLGVTPAQYLDYASLRGDTSDNLPGVPGIGEKTAAKLITTYGNLEGIYDHLDDLPPKQRTNLGDAKDAAEALRAAGNGEAVALEPRWAGAPGRSALVGLAVSTGDDAAYIDADLLVDKKVRDALSAVLGPKSPPLTVHRAKELMHG